MLGRPTPMNTLRAVRRRRAATTVCISARVALAHRAGHSAITFSSIQAVKRSRSRLISSQAR